MNQDDKQIKKNRKAAMKTAIVLGVVAFGFFAWSLYVVVSHATG